MHVNNRSRVTAYVCVLAGMAYLLFREYTYVHPYKVGSGLLGPRWTYVSTCTFTWWFLLIGAIVLTTPLLRKQPAGFLGLILLTAVLIRPVVQIKFPEEKAVDFYNARKPALHRVIETYPVAPHRTVSDQTIRELDFDELVICDSTYYFMVLGKDYPYGICFDDDGSLPTARFGRKLTYTRLDGHWYAFDYESN